MLQTCDFLYVHQNWHSVVILSVIQCPKYGDKWKSKWNFSSSQVSDHWTWFKHNLKLITPHMSKDDWKVWFLLHWVVGLRNWCLINATDTLVRSIWACILSTYIFHRFIMEIPPLTLSTDRQDLFLPKKTKLKQSWHLVKDIRHSSWEVLRIRKLLPNVYIQLVLLQRQLLCRKHS